MDKKDQDNNSVGDDFNLSHENQLPPIWEHISEELNALDGDSLSMDEPSVDSEDVSDAADFSIIKEGFQANFVAKEPPKFMWDKIEQNLESFTTTDAPSDFSAIKEGFEDQMNAALLFLEKEASKSVRTKNKTSGNQLASEKASNTSENQSTSEKTSKASESLPSKNESIKDNNGLPPVLIDGNKATNSSSNDALALGGMDTEPKSAIEKQVELEEEERLRSNLKWLANGSNPSWIEQDVMDVELLEDGLSLLIQKYIADEEIPKMEEGSFTLVQQMQKGKKIRFEVGLTAVGGTSVLLGQNTYDAWNGNTSTTTMSPTATFGLLSNYHFSLNDALVLGIYPYATVEQGFGAYNSAGNYEETQLKLSLFDISLGYQRTLIRYNNLGQIPSKMYARLDLGLGILTNAKTTVNDATINTTDLYNKFNFSVGVALGNTHEVKQFLIDYGIRGNIGLNNIVTSADPNILEPARLLNIGAFIGLRYLIVPRLEPSKKQRQFDWSPPFYIEEPAF